MREIRENDDSEIESRERLLTPEELEEFVEKFNEGFLTSEKCDRILKKHNEERRWAEDDSEEIESLRPHEAHRLYFEEGMTQKEIAEHFGYKTAKPISRMFREQGWSIRKPITYKDLDPAEVHRLYFQEGLTQEEIGEHFGFRSAYPIHCIFKERGWMAEPNRVFKNVEPSEVHRLYFQEGLTQKEVAEHFGYKTACAIQRIFKEEGWEVRPPEKFLAIDPSEVHRLYFEEERSLRDVARTMGEPLSRVWKFFKWMGWETRKTRYESEEELVAARRTQQDKRLREIEYLRDAIFGPECIVCGKEKQVIHRKDGVKHDSNLLWSKTGLKSLIPEEWAALCKPCHKIVHGLMRTSDLGWDDIYPIIKELIRSLEPKDE